MASSLTVTRAGSKRRKSPDYLCTVVQEQDELIKRQKAEIAALKKEVARLRAERDILKKAAAFFAREAT